METFEPEILEVLREGFGTVVTGIQDDKIEKFISILAKKMRKYPGYHSSCRHFTSCMPNEVFGTDNNDTIIYFCMELDKFFTERGLLGLIVSSGFFSSIVLKKFLTISEDLHNKELLYRLVSESGMGITAFHSFFIYRHDYQIVVENPQILNFLDFYQYEKLEGLLLRLIDFCLSNERVLDLSGVNTFIAEKITADSCVCESVEKRCKSTDESIKKDHIYCYIDIVGDRSLDYMNLVDLNICSVSMVPKLIDFWFYEGLEDYQLYYDAFVPAFYEEIFKSRSEEKLLILMERVPLGMIKDWSDVCLGTFFINLILFNSVHYFQYFLELIGKLSGYRLSTFQDFNIGRLYDIELMECLVSLIDDYEGNDTVQYLINYGFLKDYHKRIIFYLVEKGRHDLFKLFLEYFYNGHTTNEDYFNSDYLQYDVFSVLELEEDQEFFKIFTESNLYDPDKNF